MKKDWKGEPHRVLPRFHRRELRAEAARREQAAPDRREFPLETQEASARGVPIIGQGCGSGASPGSDPLGALLASLPNE